MIFDRLNAIFNKHYGYEEAILNPSEFHTELKNFPKTAVTFFSKKLFNLFLKKYDCEQIAVLENETTVFPVFKTKIKNRNIAVYQSPVGAPAAATLFEEMIALGSENIIAAGCCGCLDKNLKVSDIIVPNAAIRDEGLSYHYLKTGDEIELNKNLVNLVCQSLEKQKQPFVVGKTWTTDGIYRETLDKMDKRQKQGAIVVEMETAALASVAEFRKINFAQILYGADSLAEGNYDKRAFRGEKISKQTEDIIEIALLCAAFVDQEIKKQHKTEKERPQIKKRGFFKFFNKIEEKREQKRRTKNERKQF